ncbi:MAG: twin-arginine translocation signal domain-containing protein, partial [Verrucomicrobiaceae bacterium]
MGQRQYPSPLMDRRSFLTTAAAAAIAGASRTTLGVETDTPAAKPATT